MDLWTDLISALRRAPPTPLLKAVDFARLAEISRKMEICPIQDGLRFRSCFIARSIAEALVSEEGQIDLELAAQFREELLRAPFLLGLSDDNFIFNHVALCLNHLIEDGRIQKKIQTFAPPVCNRLAEAVVKQTLWPASIKQIRTSHLLRAILTAWFTWLRQITGSCFATAPAILVQEQQPLRFLQDLQDLLTRGKLSRVIEGKEYSVPLCPASVHSDLLRPLYSFDLLPYSPGLQAAFAVSGVLSGGNREEQLRQWLGKIEGARTAKELIEGVLLRFVGLDSKDLEEEEMAERLQMKDLLARQSAIHYQRESPRTKKVADWKEKVTLAFSAFQALADCSMLRAWESTLASFSDAKIDFARWNLYVSLGLHPEQPGGIGAFLYSQINEKLQIVNQHLQSLKEEYERANRAADAIEAVFERSVNEAQRQQLKSEWATAIYSAQSAKRIWDEEIGKSEQLANLFPFLINAYIHSIPELFQEVFDPALAQRVEEIVDDSTAGFRLAYKHGRSNSAVWTFIYDEKDFINSLVEFFSAQEFELVRQKPELEAVLVSLSREIIRFIQTPEYLEGTLLRAKKNGHLDKGYKKPWEYSSGGTMQTLLMAYYQRAEPFSIYEQKIERPEECLDFLENCRQLVSPGPILMQSPTHAFLFRPEWMPENVHVAMEQMRAFWQDRSLSSEEEEYLIELFSETLPNEERPLFLHRQRQRGSAGNIASLRRYLIDGQEARSETVDGFLYHSTPLMQADACAMCADRVGMRLGLGSFPLNFSKQRFWTPLALQERIKKELLRIIDTPFTEMDMDALLIEELRSKGFAAPAPIVFGDTNWIVSCFALAVSPSGRVDVWRFSRLSLKGMPLSHWFDQQGGGNWICYHLPFQYA